MNNDIVIILTYSLFFKKSKYIRENTRLLFDAFFFIDSFSNLQRKMLESNNSKSFYQTQTTHEELCWIDR